MIYPVAMVCIPVWLALSITAAFASVVVGGASMILDLHRRLALARAEASIERTEAAVLKDEVMRLEARSRGVGGTGEYRTTGIEPVASPGWAAQATPTPRGADAPRPAATDH